MAKAQLFQPDWLSAPGNTIADILDERGLTLSEFANRIHRTTDQTRDLLHGNALIDTHMARTLAYVLGSSAEFWMTREAQYRDDNSRDQGKTGLEENQRWLSEIPVTDMIRFGWIQAVTKPHEKVAASLSFFDVPDVETWRERYRDVLNVAAFRTTLTYSSEPGAVAAWLRQGEIKAAELDCKPWSATRFTEALPSIRALTRKKDPNFFLPELQKICAECGVAVVVTRAPKGCRSSGATRFLSPARALMLLSFRYLSDDQFWFTFFHEAGHLLLHNKQALFLEDGSEVTAEEETEANKFALDVLIPPIFQSKILQLRINTREILKFAKLVGVSPGIIVGQLQHMKRIQPSRLNKFKRRFKWDNIDV